MLCFVCFKHNAVITYCYKDEGKNYETHFFVLKEDFLCQNINFKRAEYDLRK